MVSRLIVAQVYVSSNLTPHTLKEIKMKNCPHCGSELEEKIDIKEVNGKQNYMKFAICISCGYETQVANLFKQNTTKVLLNE